MSAAGFEGFEITSRNPSPRLLDEFIPLMKRSGVSDEIVHTITVTNPSVAFEVR